MTMSNHLVPVIFFLNRLCKVGKDEVVVMLRMLRHTFYYVVYVDMVIVAQTCMPQPGTATGLGQSFVTANAIAIAFTAQPSHRHRIDSKRIIKLSLHCTYCNIWRYRLLLMFCSPSVKLHPPFPNMLQLNYA